MGASLYLLPGIVVFRKLQNDAFVRLKNVVPCKLLLSDFDPNNNVLFFKISKKNHLDVTIK